LNQSYFGLDIQTQAGYEIAKQGLLRPKDHSTPPIVYSIKCLELDGAFFKIGKIFSFLPFSIGFFKISIRLLKLK
jgi:hypothetical protein